MPFACSYRIAAVDKSQLESPDTKKPSDFLLQKSEGFDALFQPVRLSLPET